MKRIIAVLCAVAVAFAFAGCSNKGGSASGPKNGERTIAFVFKVAGIPYSNACKRGADEAAKKLGVNVEYTGPAAGGDVADQVRIIEGLISRHVDAIVISPNDPNSVKPVIAKTKLSCNVA